MPNNSEVEVIPPSAAIPAMESAQPAPVTKLTRAQAEQAIKDCGLTRVKIKSFEGFADLGRYIDQIGAVNVGHGLIGISIENIKDVLEKCDEIDAQIEDASGGGMDPDVLSTRAKLLEIREKLINAQITAATTLLKGLKQSSGHEYVAPAKTFTAHLTISGAAAPKAQT